MKNISLHLLLLTSLLFSACKSEAQKVVGATGNAQVEVIDFYSTHRCVTSGISPNGYPQQPLSVEINR